MERKFPFYLLSPFHPLLPRFEQHQPPVMIINDMYECCLIVVHFFPQK